jgi:hypothetical protein
MNSTLQHLKLYRLVAAWKLRNTEVGWKAAEVKVAVAVVTIDTEKMQTSLTAQSPTPPGV